MVQSVICTHSKRTILPEFFWGEGGSWGGVIIRKTMENGNVVFIEIYFVKKNFHSFILNVIVVLG
jgi:hypothetical protein